MRVQSEVPIQEEEETAASKRVQEKQQPEQVFSTVKGKMMSPFLIAMTIGALITGIALATVLTMYLTDRSKGATVKTSASSATPISMTGSNNISTTSFTSTTSPTSTTVTTTATTVTSTTSATSTTTSTTVTTTSTTATTTASTTTTTTVPPSTLCTSNSMGISLSNNEFIYSPASQQYAAGMLNNQFGVYQAYGYLSVTSVAIWTATQSSTSNACYFAGQTDRNLVVYDLTIQAVYWTAAINNNGTGGPFCLQMLDTGNLIWTDSTLAVVWQSNSTVQSG